MLLLICIVGKVNPSEHHNTIVHSAWKNRCALLILGIDWSNDAPAEEKLSKKKQAIGATNRLGEGFDLIWELISTKRTRKSLRIQIFVMRLNPLRIAMSVICKTSSAVRNMTISCPSRGEMTP